MADNKVRVYGCEGWRYISSELPISTTCPWCITITWSAMYFTTDRSCEMNLLQDLQDEFGLSYIFISHDLSVVKYIADQVMVMHQGQVVEIGNSDDIYRHPSHPYTRTLLSAIPRGVPL